MEDNAVVIAALGELGEVLACLWRMLFVEFDGDGALGMLESAFIIFQRNALLWTSQAQPRSPYWKVLNGRVLQSEAIV